jgi:hypothetical protein
MKVSDAVNGTIGFFTLTFLAFKIYWNIKTKLPQLEEADKGVEIMGIQTVAVTINVPVAEKDIVDAVLVALADLKAQKGASLIADEIPSIIKIAGELSELMAELKSKNSVAALAYLAEKLLGI